MGKNRRRAAARDPTKDTQKMLAETLSMNARLLVLLQYQAERQRCRCAGRSPTPPRDKRDRPPAVLLPRKSVAKARPSGATSSVDAEGAYMRYVDDEFQKLLDETMRAAQNS